MNANTKGTIIDLGKMKLTDTVYDRSSLIHQEQLYKVCDIIKKRVEDLDNKVYDSNVSINDVISIFARRGAGKTTFVKALSALVKRNALEDMGVKLRDLLCIDVIEPNQIHDKENFMLRFLAAIKSSFEREMQGLDIKDIRNVQEELYEALPIIDGIGKASLYSDWDDNDYLADKYIQLAMKAKDLEYKFHRYINKILELSKRKAILFIIDDADIHIEKTFEILETIRLYFTSPQIIVIMTGDLSLYGMAVRRNYWNFFDKDFIEKEKGLTQTRVGNGDEYRNAVCQLETQYLQKMIKAEHRIVLNTIYDKYRDAKDNGTQYSVNINFPGNVEESGELVAIYKKMLEKLELVAEGRDSRDLQIIRKHLLSQPFRNQYRLLAAYDEFLKLPAQSPAQEKENKEDFAAGILKVFETYINQQSVDAKRLMGKSNIYAGWLMKFMIDNDVVATGSHMLPNTENGDFNNVLFALCVWCTAQMKTDKFIAFDFLVRVSFIRQALLILDEDGKELDAFVHICHDIELHKLLGNVHAYVNAKINSPINAVRQDKNIQNSLAGVCLLPHPIETSNSVRGNLVKLTQITTIAADMIETYMCSFYKLFPCVAELLNAMNYMVSENGQPDAEKISNELEKISQLHTYIEPHKEMPPRDREKIKTYENTCDKHDLAEEEEEFCTGVYNWLNKLAKAWITPQFLDKVFARLFYTLKDIDLRDDSSLINLGERFSNYVLAFWNACLVEECIAYDRTKGIIFGYGLDIPHVFIKNYQAARVNLLGEKDGEAHKENDKEYEFFSLSVVECPLFRAYVNPFILLMLSDHNISWDQFSLMIEEISNKDIIKANEEIKEDIENKKKEIERYKKELSICDEIVDLNNLIRIIEQEYSSASISLEEKRALVEENKKHKAHLRELISSSTIAEDFIKQRIRSLSRELNSMSTRQKWYKQNIASTTTLQDQDAAQKLKKALEDFKELSVYYILSECQVK